MKLKTIKLLLVVLFSIAIIACGGGGSSNPSTPPPVTSTLSFPFQGGFRTLVTNGNTTNYTIAGTCSGTGSDVRATPVATTFEGVSALAVTATTTVNYTQCTATSGTATSTIYYDTNYANVGMSSSSQYAVLTSTPVIPISVKVGDTGTYGTANIYMNSSKTTLQGRFALSYAVEADTANTAIVVFITKKYDVNSALQWTEQDRKRIASNGTLTSVSIDRQSNVSADHLILTVTGGGSSGGTTTPSYVTQGGLTWMPETFQDTWMNANAYCTNTTINGLTGWRMPTQSELSALYASGLMNGQGWALSYDWSSTQNGAGNHYTVGLYDGSIHTTSDTSTFYVSCVHGSSGTGGTGTGVTYSGNLGGFYSIADTNMLNFNNGVGAAVTKTGTNYSYLWKDASGSLATGSYLLTTNSQALFSFSTATTNWIYCGVDSSYSSTFPLCSSIGVTFDKAAGRVTFASTPFVFYGTSLSTGITATGSLSFTPF
jgi:Protein of unknown function (DUF1566)